jgi:hypothetical protein
MQINLDLQALRNGGLVAFSGGTNIAQAGVLGATLSFLIEAVSKSKLSHVGIVPPQCDWLNPTIPGLIESTELDGISGPQYNPLGPRVQTDYADKGGHAIFLPFRPEFAPDWDALWKGAAQMFAEVKAGRLHYSVKRLFADATARNVAFAALPVAGIIDLLAEHDRGIVCSECAALLMQTGGVDAKAMAAGIPWLPKVQPIAGQAIGCSPQDLRDMPIWMPSFSIV